MAKAKNGAGKAKAKPQPLSTFIGNPYNAIKGMDGNPASPAEFDAVSHGDDEMYFVADEDADENSKSRVKILNFIHRALKYGTQRCVPAATVDDDQSIEVVHRETYKDVSFDVCILYLGHPEYEHKECYAIVKLTSDDLKSDDWYNGIISSNAAYTKEAREDGHSVKIDNMENNYWIPRWKYIVKYLRTRMADDFDKFGEEVHQEVLVDARGADKEELGAQATYESGDIIEQTMKIFSGATGKVIGTKGAKLYEIKDASHVEDIKMPPKPEDGTRTKPRELVEVVIKGTMAQINAAKVLIQQVVDEWVSDRPPRNNDFSAPPPDYGAGGNNGFGSAQFDGAGDITDWADDANEAATATQAAWDATTTVTYPEPVPGEW